MYTCIMYDYQYQEYYIIQNTHQDETVHVQSTNDDHTDESVHSDDVGSYRILIVATCHYEISPVLQSTPPLPPRLNYVELQLANEGPKRMKTDTHVTYVETKPA